MMTAGRKIFEHGARQSTGSPPAALALAPHLAPRATSLLDASTVIDGYRRGV
jgi:hypothetical protein